MIIGVSKTGVPNLGYMYSQGTFAYPKGVHLRLADYEKNIFTYLFPNIYTYITEYYYQKSLNAYC